MRKIIEKKKKNAVFDWKKHCEIYSRSLGFLSNAHVMYILFYFICV